MSDGVLYSKETQDERPNESINTNIETHYPINNRKDGDGISVINSTDINKTKHVKLHEMGEQLEIAENRCNTLKTQLDAMKKIYNSVQEKTQDSSRPAQKHIRRHSSSRVKNILLASTAKLIRSASKGAEDKESAGDCKPDDQYALSNRLTRQNSIAIGTDNTDEAVNTINNILNGITISVNRLSELHASIENDCPPTPNEVKKWQDDVATAEQTIDFDDRATGVDMVKLVSKVHQSTATLDNMPTRKGSSTNSNTIETEHKHRKRSKSRSSAAPKNSTNDIILCNKVSSKSSKSSTVKSSIKPSQKRLKLINNEEIAPEPISPSNTTIRNKKSIKRLKQPSRCKMAADTKTKPGREKNLVELYHNVAAKLGSDSEDSQHNQRPRSPNGSIPPISVECTTPGQQDQEPRLSPIAEHGFCEGVPQDIGDPNNRLLFNEYSHSNSNYQSRSYQLPTIASKLKQVAKRYINQFNFRSIPFCVATSTSPSHNIGVNIQQVMNILKTRQSFNGISPTLAHNIGIAAEKLHTAPYSEIVSSLSSKIAYAKLQCPLKQNINYQQMQEIAKDVSEEQYAEVPTYMDQQNNNPSQNTENDISENTIWSADPTKSNCTCVNPSGIGFQHVTAGRFPYSSSVFSARDVRRNLKPFTKPHQNTSPNKNNRQTPNWEEDKQNTSIIKEKNLKCVLTNLHDEFDGLNKNYEALSKRINTGELFGDKDATAELVQLEKQLTDKEEEIKIVMALYKEVVALKNQVRELKQKASQASMYLQQQVQQHQHQQSTQAFTQQASTQPIQYQQYGQQPQCVYPQAHCQSPSRRGSNRLRDSRECKDPMAALHLTKLLKQIQTYQEFYKNGR